MRDLEWSRDLPHSLVIYQAYRTDLPGRTLDVHRLARNRAVFPPDALQRLHVKSDARDTERERQAQGPILQLTIKDAHTWRNMPFATLGQLEYATSPPSRWRGHLNKSWLVNPRTGWIDGAVT